MGVIEGLSQLFQSTQHIPCPYQPVELQPGWDISRQITSIRRSGDKLIFATGAYGNVELDMELVVSQFSRLKKDRFGGFYIRYNRFQICCTFESQIYRWLDEVCFRYQKTDPLDIEGGIMGAPATGVSNQNLRGMFHDLDNDRPDWHRLEDQL